MCYSPFWGCDPEGSIWKLEGKKLLVRLTCGWQENIKLGLQGTGWDGMDWIHPTQVRE
jgi:hypothetical protein